jgi:fluoride exporter
MNWLLVFLGGGIGSLVRYFISTNIGSATPSSWPMATFLSNMLSCAVAGYLIAALPKSSLPDQGKLLLLTGFCGGFSTFSTLCLELNAMLTKENYLMAGSYVVASILLGVFILGICYKLFI